MAGLENTLSSLNEALKNTLKELKTHHAAELEAQHTVTQDPKLLPPSMPALDESVNLLHELTLMLRPPLYSLIDGIFSFVTSQALLATATAGVPDVLEQHGPLKAVELARMTTPPSDPVQLASLLHLLCSMGIYAYDPLTQAFDNSSASRLATSKHWTQWHRWVSIYDGPFYDIFKCLPASLVAGEDRTALQLNLGQPATTPVYAMLGSVPWFADLQAMMAAGATAQAPGMLADYDWKSMVTQEGASGPEGALCDLGGGDGTFVTMLARANPEMWWAVLETEKMAKVVEQKKLIDFHQPNGEATTTAAAASVTGGGGGGGHADVAHRCAAIHAGDFFQEVPPYANYVIRWTLHNWNDKDASTILVNARKSIIVRPGSRLLIVESVLEADGQGGGPRGRPALFGSLVMGAGSKGVKERTEKEWRDLSTACGWRVEGIHRLRHCIPSIIDLRPV